MPVVTPIFLSINKNNNYFSVKVPGSGAFFTTLIRNLDLGWFFFPDLGSRIGDFFSEIVSLEALFCYLYETALLIRRSQKTVSSYKNVGLILHPSFYVGSYLRSGVKILGSGINIPAKLNKSFAWSVENDLLNFYTLKERAWYERLILRIWWCGGCGRRRSGSGSYRRWWRKTTSCDICK
jgi:hypothetical protein